MLVAALRDLQWRRRRFLIAVLGTALVFAMTLVLAGLSAAFVNEAKRTLGTTGADAWVVAAGATGPINSSSVVPSDVLRATRALPGVRRADPFVALAGTVHLGGAEHVTMIGAVPGGVGSPRVDHGHPPRRPGELAVSSRLGKGVGDDVQLGDRMFRVVGIVDRSSLYGGMPNVFLTLADIQSLTFRGQPLATAIAVAGQPRGTVRDAKILDNRQARSDVLSSLGAGRDTINVVAALLWLVAACIVGSVIYLSALERVRDFAVFKATGTSTGALLGGLAIQAVIVSLVAAAVGAGVAVVMAPRFPMPAEIPALAFVLLPAVAIVVGFVASLAGLRRAVAVSPALAFGGA